MTTETHTTPPVAPRNPLQNILYALLIIATIAAAAWFRTANINDSLNFDETLDYNAALQPVPQIISDYSYSLSKVLAHFTIRWEPSERGLRLPNFLAGIGAVALMFAFAAGPRPILSRSSASFSAIALAIAPGHIDFSQNGRYYSLMCFFWLLHLFALLRYHRGQYHYLLLYIAALILGLQSHPFFLPYACTSWGAYVLYHIIIRRGVTIRQRLAMIIPPTLCFLLVMGLAWLWFSGMTDSVSAAGAANSGGEAHRLTLAKYWDMIQHMVFPFDGWIRYAWIALAAAGLVVLLIRSTPLGLILTASLLVLPLPFLFVSVSHFYAERYFAPALVIVAMAIGGALGQAFDYKASPSDEPHLNITFWEIVIAIVFPLITLSLVPSVWPLIRRDNPEHFEVTMPRNHWRQIAQYMQPHITPGDPILHNLTGPGMPDWYWVQQSKALLDFYLHRQSHPVIATSSSTPQSNITRPADLTDALTRHPHSNIWLVNWHNSPMNISKHPLAPVFPEKIRSKEISLHVLGRPTANMILHGDIEPHDLPKDPWALQSARVTTHTEQVFAGQRAIHIQSTSTTDTAYATFKIRHPGATIRNAGFDVWADDLPIGWTTNTGTTAGLARIPGGTTGPALRLTADAPTTLILTQHLRDARLPGSRITASVQVRGSAQPQIALAMNRPSGPAHIRFNPPARPPDDPDTWRTLTASGAIPADAYADSLRIEIQPTIAASAATTSTTTTASIVSPVALDDLSIAIDGRRPGRWFQPDRVHTLSLMLKARDVIRDPRNIYGRVGKIRIYGPTGTGGYFFQELGEFEGTFDWSPVHIPIDPAVFRALPDLDWVAIMVSLPETTGQVWVDNVQLEAGPASPFTPDVRLPHDETLARIQSQSALENATATRNNQSQ